MDVSDGATFAVGQEFTVSLHLSETCIIQNHLILFSLSDFHWSQHDTFNSSVKKEKLNTVEDTMNMLYCNVLNVWYFKCHFILSFLLKLE